MTRLWRVLLVRRAREWWVEVGRGRRDLGPYDSLWEAGQVASGLAEGGPLWEEARVVQAKDPTP